MLMLDGWSLPDLIILREAYNDLLIKYSNRTLATPTDREAFKKVDRCLQVLQALNEKIAKLQE